MIKKLYIKNYALLQEINIEFNNGFTVISGETGSGKSIILDALSLLLGKRIDRFYKKNQQEKSIIEGVFLLEKVHKHFFYENDLDFDQETIVRREINLNGKSRAFINDTPVSLYTLSRFGGGIIEIFDQNKTVFLENEETQFELIDELSDSENLLNIYRKDFESLNQLKKDLKIIKEQGNLSSAEIDFLKYQYNELKNANLNINEKEELEKNISLLENIDEISSCLSESDSLLNNEQGIMNYLTTIKRKLINFKNLSDLTQRIDSIIIELNDINNEFISINHSLNTDSEQLLTMNNRLDLINKLLHKHNLIFIKELITLKDDFESRLELCKSFQKLSNDKEKEIEIKKKEIEKSSKILTQKRLKNIKKIKRNIENILQKLGMPFARFDIEIKTIKEFHNNGNTTICFQFSANKGRGLEKVSKVASGGELSRLMLAMKYLSVKKSRKNTLIFDEIDTGVSGEIASLMGDMMLEISQSTQLISISHLPQIASKANIHLKVEKEIYNNQAISKVITLNKKDRIKEIAKLLSGKKLTQAAINNAIELLSQ